MILTGFSQRDYRDTTAPAGLVSFRAAVKETDLWIAAERDLAAEAVASILRRRAGLEDLIRRRPDFASTLEPWEGEDDDPVVRAMVEAGRAAGVGPMAAVAGAIAEAVARDLSALCASVLVENGGDLFLIGGAARTVGIWAGASPLSGRVGIAVDPGDGLSVCASSGTVGPSLSFGRADAAVTVSRSGALADAAATALGNRISSARDLEGALDFVMTVPGIIGAVAVIGDALGAVGDVKLVKVRQKAHPRPRTATA